MENPVEGKAACASELDSPVEEPNRDGDTGLTFIRSCGTRPTCPTCPTPERHVGGNINNVTTEDNDTYRSTTGASGTSTASASITTVSTFPTSIGPVGGRFPTAPSLSTGAAACPHPSSAAGATVTWLDVHQGE